MTTRGFVVTHAREAQFEAGSTVYQPPSIRHHELGMPGKYRGY